MLFQAKREHDEEKERQKTDLEEKEDRLKKESEEEVERLKRLAKEEEEKRKGDVDALNQRLNLLTIEKDKIGNKHLRLNREIKGILIYRTSSLYSFD